MSHLHLVIDTRTNVRYYIQNKGFRGVLMDIAIEVIESMLPKFRSEMRGTLTAIGQLSEEDITWSPNSESNSIANLVAHIRGCVHSRIEQIFFNIPDTRDRDKEFERGFQRGSISEGKRSI
ncbi:DUF1572 family protein [Paenibacillus sp. OV219]|uniref:DUF1572 family protein n=1 Tax=Paenibacillus sp. OV219 TaxID=1884377 RepID=UPI003528B146